jgi:hypothetical protein
MRVEATMLELRRAVSEDSDGASSGRRRLLLKRSGVDLAGLVESWEICSFLYLGHALVKLGGCSIWVCEFLKF